MSLNKAILIGRLGKDPEVREAGGTKVVKFSIATSEKFTDKTGAKQERTDWHNIVAWGKLAEICGHHLGRGSEVCVEGKITNRSYEDKAGNKKYISEIVASNVQFLSRKYTERESKLFDEKNPIEPEIKEYQEDEIPF